MVGGYGGVGQEAAVEVFGGGVAAGPAGGYECTLKHVAGGCAAC